MALSACVIVSTGGDADANTVFYANHSSNGVQGNDQVVHDLRPVGKLGGLEVSGPIRVEVQVGESASLDIETDSKLLPLVHSDTSGDTLKLWVDDGVRSRNGIRVTDRVPQLSTFKSVGSGSIAAAVGQKLVAQSNGSGRITVRGNPSQRNISGKNVSVVE